MPAKPTTTQLKMQLVPEQDCKLARKTINRTAAQKTTSRELRIALALKLAHF